MLLIGAKGHAKEVLEVIREKKDNEKVYFFDNLSNEDIKKLFNRPIFKNYSEAQEYFLKEKKFCLALGGGKNRKEMAREMTNIGGVLTSVISNTSLVSEFANIKVGVNIMPFVFVGNDVYIGEGSLINAHASIHHDAYIGDYCEVSPGARILGGANIGQFSSVGANAVVLPYVKVVENTFIGAGAVVTKDIDEKGVYIGIPAKKIN